MNLKTLSYLRQGSRILSKILPRSSHASLVRLFKALYKKDSWSTAVITETKILANTLKPRWPTESSSIAAPLAPFITCSGRTIENTQNFPFNLARLKNPEKCDLVICCAFEGRHHILEQVVNESLSSRKFSNIRWMLVGSKPEDHNFIRALAIKTRRVAGCIVENSPLGRKWQTSMKLASIYFDSELYGITGSDDILSRKLVEHIISRHRKNKTNVVDPEFMPSLYATIEWLVCNIDTKSDLSPQIIKCNYDYQSVFEPLGAGRFYTRSFIKKFKGEIFESKWEKCLDDKGYFLVRDNNKTIEYYTVEEGPLISVKGNWSQMNPISAFIEASTLSLQEYTFSGHSLLRESLTPASNRFLFKSGSISPQFTFSNLNAGIDNG